MAGLVPGMYLRMSPCETVLQSGSYSSITIDYMLTFEKLTARILARKWYVYPCCRLISPGPFPNLSQDHSFGSQAHSTLAETNWLGRN